MIWNDTALRNMNTWTFHEPGGHLGALTKNPERRWGHFSPRGGTYRVSATGVPCGCAAAWAIEGKT